MSHDTPSLPAALRLLSNNVLLREDDAETMAGALHIPKDSQQKPTIGTVLSCGPGLHLETAADSNIAQPRTWHRPMTISVGDRVVYSRYAGVDITIDEQEYKVLTEPEILLILPPQEPSP